MSSFNPQGVFTVQPGDVERLAPMFRPLLDRFAAETALVSADDVLAQAKRCDAQLWGYYDGENLRGAVATRVHATTAGRFCNLWVCVGFDADDLIDGVLSEIETWARSVGCHALEIVGRRGWERRLKGRGFEKTAVVLEKRLAEVH